MPAVHSFSARLAQWGQVYGVEIPVDVSVSLGIGGHVPIAGRINGTAFHSTLIPAAGAHHRLFVDAGVRAAAGASAGDMVELVIEPDPSNRVPTIPDDLAASLDLLVGARERFEAWPRSQRREVLLWIAEAVQPETRSRRIARAMARVMEDA